MMLFAIVFGLSMDYEVFLALADPRGVRPHRRQRVGGGATAWPRTGRVITAAAAIMVIVFGGFVLGDQVASLKLIGLGLAAAVLIDATVVRMVLVPATMELLGDRELVAPEVAGPDPAERRRRGPVGEPRRTVCRRLAWLITCHGRRDWTRHEGRCGDECARRTASSMSTLLCDGIERVAR